MSLEPTEERRLSLDVRRLVGTRMGIAREGAQLSQHAAGARFRITQSRWGYYERGDREPPLWLLRLLPQAFGRPLSWFFDLPEGRGLTEMEARIVSTLRSIKNPDVRDATENMLLATCQAQFDLDQQWRGR